MNPIPVIPMLSGVGDGKAFFVIGVLVALVIAVNRKPKQSIKS